MDIEDLPKYFNKERIQEYEVNYNLGKEDLFAIVNEIADNFIKNEEINEMNIHTEIVKRIEQRTRERMENKKSLEALLEFIPVYCNGMEQFIDTLDIDHLKNLSFYKFTTTILGYGSQGTVFNSIDRELIIKISFCLPLFLNKLTSYSCKLLSNNTIYRTQYSNDSIVSLPNSVSENVIAYILNNICVNVPYFANFYGMTWEQEHVETAKVSAIYEKLKTNLFTMDKMKNGINLVITIMQFLQGLSVAQQCYQLTHNDTHLGNILYEDAKEGEWNLFYNKKYKGYEVSNSYSFKVRNPGWNIKINDYGLARACIDNTVFCGDYVSASMYFFGKFSHCMDYLILFGNLFYENNFKATPDFVKNTKEIRELVRTDKYITQMANLVGTSNFEFFYFMVCPEIIKGNISKNISAIYDHKSTFRPDLKFLQTHQHFFLTPQDAINRFASVLNNLYGDRYVSMNTYDISPSCRIFDIKTGIPSRSKDRIVPIDFESVFCNKPYTIKILKKELINEYISYQLLKFENIKKPRYATDLTKNIVDIIVNVATVKIDNNKKLFSDCCGIDVCEYLMKPDRYGVVVNGVFFNLSHDNYPLGIYENSGRRERRHNIPQIYENYYRGIVISKNNIYLTPDIHNFPEYKSDSDKVDSYFAVSGPILIDKESNFLFEENLITDIEIDGINIFQSVYGPAYEKTAPVGTEYIDSNGKIQQTTKIYYNHNKGISAGELSHAGTFNPRTILAYNKNKNQVYFVVIEGRSEKSAGATIPMCTDIIRHIDKDVDFAINLDGGASSNIAFKIPGDETIYTVDWPSNTMSRPYLTGNIFGVFFN